MNISGYKNIKWWNSGNGNVIHRNAGEILSRILLENMPIRSKGVGLPKNRYKPNLTGYGKYVSAFKGDGSSGVQGHYGHLTPILLDICTNVFVEVTATKEKSPRPVVPI